MTISPRSISVAAIELIDNTIRYIWDRLQQGDLGMDIAADLGIRPGRASEVNTGLRGSHITGVRRAA